MKIKEFFKEYLYYSKTERKGIIVLVALCLLVFILPRFYLFFIKSEAKDFSAFREQMISLSDEEELILASAKMEKAPDYRLFNFNPNTASREALLSLGLPSKTVSTLLNYRSKGGQFFKKEDLLKIYTMEDSIYQRLSPFIKIPPRKKAKKAPAPKPAPKEQYTKKPVATKKVRKAAPPLEIDINLAEAEDWEKLYGIGPAYAGRILRFRDKLGGFATVDQLGETYGLPDSTFQMIKPYLKTSSPFRLLKINTASAGELKQHPYISFKQAAAIVNYRAKHGHFEKLEDLKKLHALKKYFLTRVAPYFDFSVEELVKNE